MFSPDVGANRTASRTTPRRAGRLLSLVTGASSDVRREIELASGVQRPLTMPVRIVVVGARRGVGRATTARLLARMYAHFRRDRVVLVDGVPDLGALPQDGSLDSFDAVRSSLQPADGGLWVLRGTDGTADFTPALAALSRHFAVTVVNAPTPSYGLVAGADAVVLVTSASELGLADARWRLSWLESQGLSNIRLRAVTVCSERDSVQGQGLEAELTILTDFGTGVLPHDEQLAGGLPGRVSTRTWSAALEIASKTLACAARTV
jgi:hypothetical protein